MGAEDVFDGVAGRAVSTTVIDYYVRSLANFFAPVGHGDCKAYPTHYREIDDVVADIRDFFNRDALGSENFLEREELVILSEKDVVDA